MDKVKGYIYRGDGKLTVIEVGRSMIGRHTNAGNYYIAPSSDDLATHFESMFAFFIKNAVEEEEKEEYRKTLEKIVYDIFNGEVVELKLT